MDHQARALDALVKEHMNMTGMYLSLRFGQVKPWVIGMLINHVTVEMLASFGNQLSSLVDPGTNKLEEKQKIGSRAAFTGQGQCFADVTDMDFDLLLRCAQNFRDSILAFRDAIDGSPRLRAERV